MTELHTAVSVGKGTPGVVFISSAVGTGPLFCKEISAFAAGSWDKNEVKALKKDRSQHLVLHYFSAYDSI